MRGRPRRQGGRGAPGTVDQAGRARADPQGGGGVRWARPSPTRRRRAASCSRSPVAMLAGLVSFLSPCVLPLVPGYLSYMTGLAGADLDAALDRPARRGRRCRGAASRRAVAVRSGRDFSARCSSSPVHHRLRPRRVLGPGRAALLRHERSIEIVVGVVVIVLGLAFLGSSRGSTASAGIGAAQGRPGRRAGTRGGVRAVLDAVPRPDARRRARPGDHERSTAGRSRWHRVLPRPGLPFSCSALGFRGCSAVFAVRPPAQRLGDPDRRRTAGPRRPGAGHRRLERLRRLAAGHVGPGTVGI